MRLTVATTNHSPLHPRISLHLALECKGEVMVPSHPPSADTMPMVSAEGPLLLCQRKIEAEFHHKYQNKDTPSIQAKLF